MCIFKVRLFERAGKIRDLGKTTPFREALEGEAELNRQALLTSIIHVENDKVWTKTAANIKLVNLNTPFLL